ncbi:nucleotide cyclase [Haematococcus lacustris]
MLEQCHASFLSQGCLSHNLLGLLLAPLPALSGALGNHDVQMFPHHIIAYLACNNGRGLNPSMSMSSVATGHHDVTLLFMDIVGFTSMSKAISAGEVMAFLNELFSLYDRLVERHGVHKVETAGDCYIVSAGVVAQGSDGYMHVLTSHDAADSARRVLSFAKDMLAAAQKVRMPHNQEPACIRIGLHTGDCTSGLIGSRLPKFSIFG